MSWGVRMYLMISSVDWFDSGNDTYSRTVKECAVPHIVWASNEAALGDGIEVSPHGVQVIIEQWHELLASLQGGGADLNCLGSSALVWG